MKIDGKQKKVKKDKILYIKRKKYDIIISRERSKSTSQILRKEVEHLTTKNTWISIPIDEQETIINLDYFEHKMKIYTSNQPTAKRLQKRIGESTKTFFTNEKISGKSWTIFFDERETIKKAISLGSLLTMNQSKIAKGKVIEDEELQKQK